jgi:hypothetical protein
MHAPKGSRFLGWLGRFVRWSFTTLAFLLLALWATVALYYSNLPWPSGRLLMSAAFGIFAVWAFWVNRRPRWRKAFGLVFLLVVVWHLLIPPSNDRPWRREVAVLPSAILDGNRVRLVNYRNFAYRSALDFDALYEEREIDVSRIDSLDLFISYWKIGPVAHTFVSFNFDDGSPPVCISIEVRPEIGESFDPFSSMFKQFELVYIVGDERDLVGVRTEHRNEDVFLYRINASPEAVRDLFRIYLERINLLADRPEWYHLLTDNCTINVIRYARKVGGPHRRFDVRHIVNGFIDTYLYYLGLLDTQFPFAELRQRSHINEAARAAAVADGGAGDFSARIRMNRPGIDLGEER